jgi:hypothetical protein
VNHLFSSLIVFGLLAPQAQASEEQDCIRTRTYDAYEEGWKIRATSETTLALGHTEHLKTTLIKGRQYRVITCSDSGVKELDVILYDKKGNILTRDQQEGPTPSLVHQTTANGLHYLVLYLRDADDREAPQNVAWALLHHD